MDKKIIIPQAFPRTSAFFSLGVEEMASRLKSVGYEEQIIFVEFEPANIDYILLSDFELLAKQNREKKIVLISSRRLLPLASLYGAMFNTRTFVFSAHDSLLYLVREIISGHTATTVLFPNPKVLSVKEAIIMENTLKGESIYRIGRHLGLDTKTIYHWRRSAETKLGVRKLTDLRLRIQ
ncbi:TPA: LuxR C-terminal-related transcriptional regulator [Serratia marcescens]